MDRKTLEGYIKINLPPSERARLKRANSVDALNKLFVLFNITEIIDKVFYLMLITEAPIINKGGIEDIGLDDYNFYIDLFEKSFKKDNRRGYWETYGDGF